MAEESVQTDDSKQTSGLSDSEREKIKKLAEDFWINYGEAHQDDVSSWSSNADGKKLIEHFKRDRKVKALKKCMRQ